MLGLSFCNILTHCDQKLQCMLLGFHVIDQYKVVLLKENHAMCLILFYFCMTYIYGHPSLLHMLSLGENLATRYKIMRI